jgi:hypothetical protein
VGKGRSGGPARAPTPPSPLHGSTYPDIAWVLKVDCQEKIEAAGRKWKVSFALAGDYVHLPPSDHRILVYHWATLVGELDPRLQRSTIFDRWSPLNLNPSL